MKLRPPFLKRIDTYLIGKFLGTYFFSIILIISVAVVFDYNDNIDKLTQNGAPWQEILIYYLNWMPYYANLFSALFVFISVIFFIRSIKDKFSFPPYMLYTVSQPSFPKL